MSDIFRIFVTEKEIVIRIFTIKTPRRWAKRQRDMRNMRKMRMALSLIINGAATYLKPKTNKE